MRFFHIISAGVFVGLFSCNSGNTLPESNATAATQVKANPDAAKSKLKDADTKMLMTTVASYYHLKDAMVATNAAKINEAAKQMSMMSDSLDKTLRSNYGVDDTVTAYDGMKKYLDTIATQSKAIMQIVDATCEKQRLAFGTLSSAMYGLLKKVALKNAGVYHQYCPMAFNEKGAYWLSDVNEIQNPYFGKKMLECGEVTDSLK